MKGSLWRLLSKRDVENRLANDVKGQPRGDTLSIGQAPEGDGRGEHDGNPIGRRPSAVGVSAGDLTDPEGGCLQPALGRFDEELYITLAIKITAQGQPTHLLADILTLTVAATHAPPRVILRFLRERLSIARP
jgi:hypothetical protein